MRASVRNPSVRARRYTGNQDPTRAFGSDFTLMERDTRPPASDCQRQSREITRFPQCQFIFLKACIQEGDCPGSVPPLAVEVASGIDDEGIDDEDRQCGKFREGVCVRLAYARFRLTGAFGITAFTGRFFAALTVSRLFLSASMRFTTLGGVSTPGATIS
jgi:hypothetical protein